MAIILLAAVLRFAVLGWKPAHFDEGVNGFFVDEMTRNGFYRYDPTNFHGPLHFYVLFVAQTLFGRGIEVLRWPLAFVGWAAVAFALFGFRRFISRNASRWAALAMAISPGLVFYGRYAIHESWLTLFLMMTVAGIAELWRYGSRRGLWFTVLGLAGMILTKETWVIHVIALGLAMFAMAGLDFLTGSRFMKRGRWKFSIDEASWVAAVGVTLIVFFYSGAFLNPEGVPGLVQTYLAWFRTGTGGESGHEKEWWYWLQLLGNYEWLALLGAGAAVFVVLPKVNRFVRWLAISALGTHVAYSLIDYKTPWCLIAWMWAFCVVFGVAIDWAMKRLDRLTVGVLAGLAALFSLWKSVELNFKKFADENEPYVYVQTTMEIDRLLEPLTWQARRDPSTRFRSGHVIQPEHHPLRWLLADRPKTTWGDQDATPEPLDAEWLLVDTTAMDRIEARLRDDYFRTNLKVRGMAPDTSVLYLRAKSFAEFFPGRTPEFLPPKEEPLLEPKEPESAR